MCQEPLALRVAAVDPQTQVLRSGGVAKLSWDTVGEVVVGTMAAVVVVEPHKEGETLASMRAVRVAMA